MIILVFYHPVVDMNVKQVINYILCGFKSLNLNLLNLQKLCCLCFCFHNWAELTFLRLSCVVIKENSIKSPYLEFISSKMLSSIKIINIKVSLLYKCDVETWNLQSTNTVKEENVWNEIYLHIYMFWIFNERRRRF